MSAADETGCGERWLRLTNRDGGRLSVRLRGYRAGDEAGMIACIRDEYGDTYFKRSLYEPVQIQKEAESGHMTFLIAEVCDGDAAGEIAGMLLLKEFYPEESMCEIASQIFRKKYRGFGLAAPFFEYGLEILKSRNYSAAYCLPVLFHDTTQRLLHRMGLFATGFVLGVFNMEKIKTSYPKGRNRKHAQGIQIMALGKRDAGRLFLPPELAPFCGRIYARLGVTCRICGGPEWEYAGRCKKMPETSVLRRRQDPIQCSTEIHVVSIGADLPERIAKIHEKYPLTGLQTANIFLNASDCYAVWAYRKLRQMGYFFTGCKPLCSENEYLVLHHAGSTEYFFSEYAMTEEFYEIFLKIKEIWRDGHEEETKHYL